MLGWPFYIQSLLHLPCQQQLNASIMTSKYFLEVTRKEENKAQTNVVYQGDKLLPIIFEFIVAAFVDKVEVSWRNEKVSKVNSIK